MSEFVPVVRVWRSERDGATESEDTLVNFDHVARMRPKAFYDTAEAEHAVGTELVFVDGSRFVVGDSMAAITNRLS